ncbi:hypothetical protein P171DRAFT_436713 [Karstenula rhodostoma CBS 690.94]|uniref:Uncharacterized protein n=1 Tax=Karstenula rhodostoma CBS 690.94 TaxID=1392251 RepID=A0A9P4U791_9PLEO|nr:hypothetical protein P171DRAFT_436713 [Karstenula rhodostoma CBS 690.94]
MASCAILRVPELVASGPMTLQSLSKGTVHGCEALMGSVRRPLTHSWYDANCT